MIFCKMYFLQLRSKDVTAPFQTKKFFLTIASNGNIERVRALRMKVALEENLASKTCQKKGEAGYGSCLDLSVLLTHTSSKALDFFKGYCLFFLLGFTLVNSAFLESQPTFS